LRTIGCYERFFAGFRDHYAASAEGMKSQTKGPLWELPITALLITPAECKGARKLPGWSQEDLATMLLIGQDTIGGFERRERRSPSLNRRKLRAVFEAAGVEFAEEAEPKLNAKSRTIAAGDLNASNDAEGGNAPVPKP
jgi:hypothetical protein